jgi:predicted choloylglycine hydrolase
MMMHELTLRGTPAQMGTEHGSLMAQIGFELPPQDPRLIELAVGCEEQAIRHTPELVEEMRAFAAAAYVSYDLFKAFTLTIPLQQNIPSCSVVAVMPERSAGGKLMVGRNYDFVYDISWEAATIYSTYPETGQAHIGSCDIWIGREDGLNESGLFVAMSATFLPGIQAGLPFWFIVRHILETCKTIDEALTWIQAVPHSQSRNYMLADAKKAVVVEATINGVCVREPENGVLVMTNHPAHPQLKEQVNFVPDDSLMRYDRLNLLSSSQVTLDDIKTALNDRKNRVCAHEQFDGNAFGTIWSVIAYPEERRLAIAPGTGDNKGTMTYRSYTL